MSDANDFAVKSTNRRAVQPDVTVVIGTTEFQCHKVILCQASEYFDAMLSSEMKESNESRIVFEDKFDKFSVS